jgi:hypothetical protein
MSLSEKQIQVLKFLAENGPKNAYQVKHNTDMPYSTVHNAVKDMLRQQFILLHAETKNIKGVSAKDYRLTLKGLLVALTRGADLKKTASNWANLLPLILGKLDYWDEHGLKAEIQAFLTVEVERWYNVTYDQWDDDFALYDFMAHFRDALFLFKLFTINEGKDATEGHRAIRGDSKLREWAVEALKEEIAYVEALVNLLKDELELFESTEEPNWSKAASNLKKWQNTLLAHI